MTPYSGDASSWRHLILGDASSWRRLILAMPHLGDASNGQSVDFLPWIPRVVPLYVDFDFDFDFGQHPRTGQYRDQTAVSWHLHKTFTKREVFLLKK